MPGKVSRLPFHGKALAWNNLSHFPSIIADRWPFYVEQNGLTPIAALAHRLDLLTRLDLRPILAEIPTEVLLVHGNEDRIVGRRYFDELKAGLPKSAGLILPIVGHQPHYTHSELLAQVVGELPAAVQSRRVPERGEGRARLDRARSVRDESGVEALAPIGSDSLEPHRNPRLVIVGIGDDGLAGLTDAARRTIVGGRRRSSGPRRTLRLVDEAAGRKVALDPDMPAALRQVREALAARRPVLVSEGDPLFYGVARYLCDRLGKDHFEVVPHVSSMQLAFARVKESWEDAYLTNLAGRPLEAVSTGSGRPRRSACSRATTARRRGSRRPCSTAGSTTSRPTSARTSARPTSG